MPPGNGAQGQAALTRRVGLLGATLAGMGIILGAGIYVLLGVAAGWAGGAVWLAFLLAAGAATLTGLAYAELGAMVPLNAPEFQYTRVAFGARTGFVVGWLMLWADVISAAAVAVGFGGYFSYISGLPPGLSAFLLVVGCAMVVFLGIRESILLAGAFTLIEAAGIVFVTAVGVPQWGRADYLTLPQGFSGLWSAAALVFFAYLGFEEIGNLAEEMRHPERDIPRAILLAMAATTVLYVLVAVSAVSVVDWPGLAASPAPLAVVVQHVLGERASLFFAAVALFSTANTALLLLLAASRSLYGMAQARALPAWLGAIGERQRTPWVAIVLVGVFAGLFTQLGEVGVVAQFTNAVTLAVFAAINLAVIWLRRARPAQRRPFRVPLSVRGVPVLSALAALLCAGLVLGTGWAAVGVGVALTAIGLAVHASLQRRAGKAQPPG